MKTLSEAAQVAVINEAGSTYRNIVLSLIREGDYSQIKAILDFATTVTENYINIVTNKME